MLRRRPFPMMLVITAGCWVRNWFSPLPLCNIPKDREEKKCLLPPFIAGDFRLFSFQQLLLRTVHWNNSGVWFFSGAKRAEGFCSSKNKGVMKIQSENPHTWTPTEPKLHPESSGIHYERKPCHTALAGDCGLDGFWVGGEELFLICVSLQFPVSCFVWNSVPTLLFSFHLSVFHTSLMENEKWEMEAPEKMIA